MLSFVDTRWGIAWTSGPSGAGTESVDLEFQQMRVRATVVAVTTSRDLAAPGGSGAARMLCGRELPKKWGVRGRASRQLPAMINEL